MSAEKKPLRSQPTRDRILAAARAAFAKDGYERATIRGIAEAAAINPSMVIRYYGSKEALFAQVSTLDFNAAHLAAVPRSQMGAMLVRHVLGRWEDPVTGAAMAAMMRAAFSHGPAQDRVSALFGSELGRLFHILGIADRAPEVAPLVATQLIGLGMLRYVVKIPAVTALPEEVVVNRIGQVVQGYIDTAFAGEAMA